MTAHGSVAPMAADGIDHRDQVARFPDHVHIDARWVDGGIGRFAANVVPLVIGGGRELHGRMNRSRPPGQAQLAARFAPLAPGGGLLFSPGFAPPFVWERRTIVTVHDLHYLDPTIANSRQHEYFRRVMVPQLRRCRLVLTVSEASAGQIRAVLGDRAPDVVVVGNGVDAGLLDAADAGGDGPPQLLFVGGDKVNKNLPMALRAFDAARSTTGAEMVVVGPVADDIEHTAPVGVEFVGSVSEQRLAELYGRSTALLMPSISEGFGLPALEAMVAGTPVIFGNRDALPDVVGEHGWPVDPFDAESIAAGISESVHHPIEIDGATRRDLVEGHQWCHVAQRIVAAVKEVQ